jgi:hypothetical protein
MAYKESIIVLPSFTSPTTADLAELHKLTDRERAWNQGMPSYPDEQTIMRAYRYTELVKVREDTNMRPVTRFIKPELHSVFPPFLLPIAQQVRREVGALWRARASELGVDPAIRLAITVSRQSVIVATPSRSLLILTVVAITKSCPMAVMLL